MNQTDVRQQQTQGVTKEGFINLGLGHPDPSLFPVDLIRDSAMVRFESNHRSYLQYGYEQGEGGFRIELSQFLNRIAGVRVAPENLFVTGGASQALDIICTLFTAPGDSVIVEEPTYFLAIKIFRDHGLNIVSVPTDDNGMEVDRLSQLVDRHSPKLVYTVPAHQNPSGVTLSAERRRDLSSLAQDRGFLIVADEVYHLLTYSGEPPQPFAATIDNGQVIALGSFSKILAPGLRTGWIAAARQILDRLFNSGFLDSGGGLSPFTSALLTDALANQALDRHVRRLRTVYGERRDALVAAIQEHHLPERGLAFRHPHGGYYLWTQLPEKRDAEALLREATAHGVGFLPGVRSSSTGGYRDRMRLCFAYYPPEILAEGVRRLASVV